MNEEKSLSGVVLVSGPATALVAGGGGRRRRMLKQESCLSSFDSQLLSKRCQPKLRVSTRWETYELEELISGAFQTAWQLLRMAWRVLP